MRKPSVNFTKLGGAVVAEIIRQGMFRIERVDDNHIVIWQGSANEQIGATIYANLPMRLKDSIHAR